VHGEAAALLAALAFVHRGYARLWSALAEAPGPFRRRAARLVDECLGLDGILDGQARDVHFDARRASAAEVVSIAEGKTVTLLRLALVLPALVAGSTPRWLARLERLARAWGLAYQILDDLAEPAADADDARRGRPNLALVAGETAARERLAVELAAADVERLALGAALAPLAAPFARLAARFASQAASSPGYSTGSSAA
jgi:geranylgeranyl pyrophosphate synthase